MKKLIFILLIVFLFTGCYNINNLSYDNIIDVSLVEKAKSNTFTSGYKFYTPVGMNLTNDINGNNIFYSKNDKYYMYVDIVSYYNKTKEVYSNTDNSYYFKEINYNDKVGYVLINQISDGYLLEIMYNYAKIEVVTNDINESLSKSLVILNSITYNDKVVKTLIDDNGINDSEEVFSLLGPNVYTDNFLQYIEEYGTYDDSIQDEDTLDLDLDLNSVD